MLSEKKEEVLQYTFQKNMNYVLNFHFLLFYFFSSYCTNTRKAACRCKWTWNLIFITITIIFNMLIIVPLFLDRHTLHAERCREISTATGIANKGCKLTTQPLPPVPVCYYESPVQGDDHEPYYLVPIKVRVKWFHRIHFLIART